MVGAKACVGALESHNCKIVFLSLYDNAGIDYNKRIRLKIIVAEELKIYKFGGWCFFIKK